MAFFETLKRGAKKLGKDAAKAAKMRKEDYLRVYGIAAATLRQALEDGRSEFSARVFY